MRINGSQPLPVSTLYCFLYHQIQLPHITVNATGKKKKKKKKKKKNEIKKIRCRQLSGILFKIIDFY